MLKSESGDRRHVASFLLAIGAIVGALAMAFIPWQPEAIASIGIIGVTAVLLLYDRLRHAREHERVAVQAAELAVEAEQGRARAAELAALVRFSQALSFCTDTDSLRRTVLQELPSLIGRQHFWLRTRPGGSEMVIAPDSVTAVPAGPDAWETFPLMAGHRDVGMLGVRQEGGPLTDTQRRTVELAALILAVSVRKVQLFNRLAAFTTVDPLTGCLTRQHGLEMFAAEMSRAHRTGTPPSVLLLELVDFEQITTAYGESVADRVLAQLGLLFKRDLRASDIRCRYGSASFAFMLPDTPVEGAVRAARDLRAKTDDVTVTAGSERVAVTARISVAACPAGESDPVDCLRRAEAALHQAQVRGYDVPVGEKAAAGPDARRPV